MASTASDLLMREDIMLQVVSMRETYMSTILLVLDFKDKKAIDLYRNERNANKKNSVDVAGPARRRFDERNKKWSRYSNGGFSGRKKNCCKAIKNALKYLHELYGYDFTQPHKITGFLGKFTAKNIENNWAQQRDIACMRKRRP